MYIGKRYFDEYKFKRFAKIAGIIALIVGVPCLIYFNFAEILMYLVSDNPILLAGLGLILLCWGFGGIARIMVMIGVLMCIFKYNIRL